MLCVVPDIVKVTAKDTIIKELSMVYYKKGAMRRICRDSVEVERLEYMKT